MLDRDRIVAKIDNLDGYLMELEMIAPKSYGEYEKNIEKKRACERLLQIAIEAAIDVSRLLLKGLRLGLPADEDDIFSRLQSHGVLSVDMVKSLRMMKGARNILVHEYGKIDDRLVFEMLRKKEDYERFRKETVEALSRFAGT